MKHFTVLTWNVENLFPPGPIVAGSRSVQPDEYEAKLAALAAIINETIKPDVIALQEIGGRNREDTRSFDDLQRKLGGQFPHGALSPETDGRCIRLGFLSRIPLHDPKAFKTFDQTPAGWPSTYHDLPKSGRGGFAVTVKLPSRKSIRLFNCHLKSKLVTYKGPGGSTRFDTDDEAERAAGASLALIRRTAEAHLMRLKVCEALAHGQDVILMGDLNDSPKAATSQLLLGPEDADATRPDRRDPTRLYNLCDAIPGPGNASFDVNLLPENEQFSRMHKGRREMLDQIMVNRALLAPDGVARPDSWLVKEVRSLVEGIDPISNNPAERIGTRLPDHAPVYARFAWSQV